MSNVGKRGKLKLESRLRAALLNGTNTRLEHHEIERIIEALSKPQAREDAKACYDCATDRPHRTSEACTHPAPDALRVAVEALEAIKEVSGGRAASGYNETGRLARINERCDQALAALQAEQGAK